MEQRQSDIHPSLSLLDTAEQQRHASVDRFVQALRNSYLDDNNNGMDYDSFVDHHFNECLPLSLDDLYEPSALSLPTVQVVFAIMYGLIWIFGVGGNLLVLLVLGYSASSSSSSANCSANSANGRTRKRNAAFPVRSVFVASLASADLLVALTSLPVTAVTAFTRQWIFPSFLCYCIPFFQAFSIFQSSFTLTALAIDRYLLIAFPRRTFVTYDRARVAVVGTALIAAAIASPMAIFMSVVEIPPMCGAFCVETWPPSSSVDEFEEHGDMLNFDDQHSAGLSRRIYGLFVAVLQLCLPTAVTSVCYVLISNKLERQDQARRATHLLLPEMERRLSYRRRRTNRMMAMMVAAFGMLWLPLNAMNLLRDFGVYGELFDHRSFNINYAACHLVAMLSVVVNPILYAWYNESIKSIVLSFCVKCRRVVVMKSNRRGGRTVITLPS